MVIVRLCKITLVASVALLFTLIALDNITDYNGDWQFVQHVLSMDTIYPSSSLHWRAIKDSTVQEAAYLFIIATEAAVAVLLWLGACRLVMTIGTQYFARAKSLAIAGLTIGLLLYMAGFIAIGGQWFVMWQSQSWNGQQKAFDFIAMIGAVLIVVLLTED